jgi:hypothetical protein
MGRADERVFQRVRTQVVGYDDNDIGVISHDRLLNQINCKISILGGVGKDEIFLPPPNFLQKSKTDFWRRS